MSKDELEQEPFINKPCVSQGVCEHDKNSVLKDIKAEIEYLKMHKAKYLTDDNELCISALDVLEIIDRHISGEEQTGENT